MHREDHPLAGDVDAADDADLGSLATHLFHHPAPLEGFEKLLARYPGQYRRTRYLDTPVLPFRRRYFYPGIRESPESVRFRFAGGVQRSSACAPGNLRTIDIQSGCEGEVAGPTNSSP